MLTSLLAVRQNFLESHTQVVLVVLSRTDALLWSGTQIVKVLTSGNDSVANMLELGSSQVVRVRTRFNIWQRTATGQIIVGDPPIRSDRSKGD
jgi:hypothetical protein